MKKVMMILGLVCLTSPAFAKECKVMISGNDVVYKVAEGSTVRNMTYKEMFDFMNDSGKPAGEILKIVNAARIEHKKADDEIVRIGSLGSVPKRGKADPNCKDKSITGYECRDRQLRSTFEAEEGIETETEISVRKSNKVAIRDLAHAFNCEIHKPVATTASAPANAPADDGPAPADDGPAPADVPNVAAPGTVASLSNRPRGVGPNENAQPRMEVHPRAEDVVSNGVAPAASITVDTTSSRAAR